MVMVLAACLVEIADMACAGGGHRCGSVSVVVIWCRNNMESCILFLVFDDYVRHCIHREGHRTHKLRGNMRCTKRST